MSVTLRQLEVFAAVVQSGSISRATRRVGLSQPTVSQQIARLEEDLGTQLIVRSRAPSVELTPAGEFWFRHAQRLLTHMAHVELEHAQTFGGSCLSLHFGTTPSLRGRFLGAAARIAASSGAFSRFAYRWSLNSRDVVEQVSLRQINCAVVSEASVRDQCASLSVTHLYNDRIVLVVPEEVPPDALFAALDGGRPDSPVEALRHYVDVGDVVPWNGFTADWYRTYMPWASPSYGCITHEASVEFVAAGLATCHAPLSLFPSLPDSVRRRVRLYALQGAHRHAVLIMPKHLLSIGPFADFRRQLADFAIREYSREMEEGAVYPLPLDQQASPAL